MNFDHLSEPLLQKSAVLFPEYWNREKKQKTIQIKKALWAFRTTIFVSKMKAAFETYFLIR